MKETNLRRKFASIAERAIWEFCFGKEERRLGSENRELEERGRNCNYHKILGLDGMVGYELGLGSGYRSNLCTNILDHSESISIELTRNTYPRRILID